MRNPLCTGDEIHKPSADITRNCKTGISVVPQNGPMSSNNLKIDYISIPSESMQYYSILSDTMCKTMSPNV